MARYEHLPIYKTAMDLAVYLEQVVRNFSRYHKYTLGSDLRQQSREPVRMIHECFRCKRGFAEVGVRQGAGVEGRFGVLRPLAGFSAMSRRAYSVDAPAFALAWRTVTPTSSCPS